jgi:microcystin-dependent protein
MKLVVFLIAAALVVAVTCRAVDVNNYLKANSEDIAAGMAVTNLPRGTILMIGSSEIDNWFNMLGAGIGEYKGWFICDGRNGTPDLRGRFVVGRDSLNAESNFGHMGAKGGRTHVKLEVDDLPPHTHSVIADTTADGGHSHTYDDAVGPYCGTGATPDRWTEDLPNRYGALPGDYFVQRNGACHARRNTHSTGNHKHTLNTKTDSGNGKGREIVTLPPYYVIAYIIYIG